MNPPTEDTEFTFRVFDKFGCEGLARTSYESIVTKASFTVDANWTQSPRGKYVGEAPLTVSFINESENGTPGYFEWFLYRDIDEIKEESEGSTEPVDSIMLIAFDDAPEYTYENSGSYLVKLVAKNGHSSYYHLSLLYCGSHNHHRQKVKQSTAGFANSQKHSEENPESRLHQPVPRKTHHKYRRF